MEFENFTPFPALPFVTVDRDEQESHVVVMRGTFLRLEGYGRRGLPRLTCLHTRDLMRKVRAFAHGQTRTTAARGRPGSTDRGIQ
jgi:hypothetical protein